jgi:filamentous hemagglutinin
VAGNEYRQAGSDVLAPSGDINILARKGDIVEGRETSASQTEQKSKQSGLTLAITSPIITAVQTAQNMGQAASQTSEARNKVTMKSGGDTQLKGAVVAANQVAAKVGGKTLSTTSLP